MKKGNHSYNIYNELKELECSNISKTGHGLKKLFKNRSVKSFLDHHVMMKELNQRITNSLKYDSVQGRPIIDYGPGEELDRMCINLNDGIGNDKPPEDFTELLTRHVERIIKNPKPIISLRKDSFFKSMESHKKFKIKPGTIEYLHLMRNKSPNFIKYNPNLNAIFPHVPYAHFKPLDLKKQSSINYSCDLKKTGGDSLQNNTNANASATATANPNPNDTYEIEHYSSQKVHGMSFNKYSSRNDLFYKPPYKDSIISPKIIRNISSPNFKKMSSRHKKILAKKLPPVIDYNPNYKALYNTQSMNSYINDSLSKKKAYMRKISSSYSPTTDYLSVPRLNGRKTYTYKT